MTSTNTPLFWKLSWASNLKSIISMPKSYLIDILYPVYRYTGECPQTFQGMSPNNLGNIQEDSGESKFWFISWNLACFLSSLAVKLLQSKGKNTISSLNYWANHLKKTFSTLILITNLLSLITVLFCYFFLSFSFFPYVGGNAQLLGGGAEVSKNSK